MGELFVIQGDITEQAVDAVVNAANESLSDGAGVNGAIHVAAGPGLEAACRRVAPCPTGDARITEGFALPTRYIIHTVGPVWHGGDRDEDELLASCYRKSLKLAAEHGVETISFPSISTGIFGFPLDRAAHIAMHELKAGLERHPAIQQVIMVCWGKESLRAHREALKGRSPG